MQCQKWNDEFLYDVYSVLSKILKEAMTINNNKKEKYIL